MTPETNQADSTKEQLLLWLRSGFWVMSVSIRRLLFTWQSGICLGVLCLLSALALLWMLYGNERAHNFADFILARIFIAIFLPLAALCFGTASIGRERDSKTLVYLISSPTPRPVLYFGKFLAAFFVTMLWTVGGYLWLLLSAGIFDWKFVVAYLPAVLLGTLAYVALFQMLSVLIRYATIVSFLYVVFLETLIGNVPGTTKRVTVSFYIRCMLRDASEVLGDTPPQRGVSEANLFQPVSGDIAQLALIGGAVVLILIGSAIFWRKEYV